MSLTVWQDPRIKQLKRLGCDKCQPSFLLPGSEAAEWFVYNHLGHLDSRPPGWAGRCVNPPHAPKDKLRWESTHIEQKGFLFLKEQKIRQDAYLRGTWQTESAILFVWTRLGIDRGKEWLLKILGFLVQNDSLSAHTHREIYNTFCLFGGCKLSLFLRFSVTVFNLPRGSFLQWCVKSPKERRWFIKQGGVKKRTGSIWLDNWGAEQPGSWVLSSKPSKPTLKGWLCPSLVLWLWANYFIIYKSPHL